MEGVYIFGMKANATDLESELATARFYRNISLRVQLAILQALDAKAQKKGMTRTSCIIDAINDWLDDE